MEIAFQFTDQFVPLFAQFLIFVHLLCDLVDLNFICINSFLDFQQIIFVAPFEMQKNKMAVGTNGAKKKHENRINSTLTTRVRLRWPAEIVMVWMFLYTIDKRALESIHCTVPTATVWTNFAVHSPFSMWDGLRVRMIRWTKSFQCCTYRSDNSSRWDCRRQSDPLNESNGYRMQHICRSHCMECSGISSKSLVAKCSFGNFSESNGMWSNHRCCPRRMPSMCCPMCLQRIDDTWSASLRWNLQADRLAFSSIGHACDTVPMYPPIAQHLRRTIWDSLWEMRASAGYVFPHFLKKFFCFVKIGLYSSGFYFFPRRKWIEHLLFSSNSFVCWYFTAANCSEHLSRVLL